MNNEKIHFETTTNGTVDFALIGKSYGNRKLLELHNIHNGKIGEQIAFSKKRAQKIFSIFDTEKYIPKAFKDFIPNHILLANDNTTDGLHLIWSAKATVRHLFFSENCGIKTGKYATPDLIFRYHKNTLAIYATYSGNIQSDSPLFHAPFFNVYSDANICMGNVNIAKAQALESFDSIVDYLQNAFFNSVFTHSNNTNVTTESITKYHNRNVYNFSDLSPFGNTKKALTINDLI